MPTSHDGHSYVHQLLSRYCHKTASWKQVQYVLEDISVSEEGEIIELPRGSELGLEELGNTGVGSEEKEKTLQAKYGETV